MQQAASKAFGGEGDNRIRGSCCAFLCVGCRGGVSMGERPWFDKREGKSAATTTNNNCPSKHAYYVGMYFGGYSDMQSMGSLNPDLKQNMIRKNGTHS